MLSCRSTAAQSFAMMRNAGSTRVSGRVSRPPTASRNRASRRQIPTQAALKPAGGYKSTWKQSTNEVYITVPIPDDVRGGDVGLEVHPKRLVLQINGKEALAGYFAEESTEPMVQPDGCFWNIETDDDGVRAIQVVLEKKEIGHESWEALIEGDGPDTTFTNFAYFDLATEDGPLGTLVFGLYGMVVPKTVLNFVELCRGKDGIQGEDVEGREKADEKKEILTYKGSPFHRIIPTFMAQGGDITMGDGTGGKSIYGEEFEDENFTLKHDEAGVLSMANAGPNTNGSQFFLLFEPQPHLNGKHTVFGKLIEDESMRTLRLLESLGSQSGETSKAVYVKECGEIMGEDMNEFLTTMVATAPRHNLPDDATDVLGDTEGMTPEMMEEMAKEMLGGKDGMPSEAGEGK